jgi:hypothetical protein
MNALAGVTYPSDKGNYIMSAKDGANCKKLVTWLKKVSASEQAPEDMVHNVYHGCMADK